MYCEICGKKADIHHIIHRNEGGLDFNLNFKYLCALHHRGSTGPHKNKLTDLKYKLELQNNLYSTLTKEYYSLKEIINILGLSNGSAKKLKNKLSIYKEGYKREDIILFLMCNKRYSEEFIEDFILNELIIKAEIL